MRDLTGSAPGVEKRGDPAALAREAAALERLGGVAWAPRLVSHAPGVLVSTRVPGAPRDLGGLAPGDARRLGAVVAAAHAVQGAAEGGLWWWDAPARSLAAYRAGRAADAAAALAGTPDAGLPARAAATAPPPPGDLPFRLCHGDLVAANVVWGPGGPALVDWEFWRMADPAEDLAYLVVVNDLPPAIAGEVLAGYGDPSMPARVAAWGPLVAADAGGWYRAHGMRREAAEALARARRLLGDPA